MGDIEDADHENAHAVGELGRLDPAYGRSERVRAQARALAKGASAMEEVFEKVRWPRACLFNRARRSLVRACKRRIAVRSSGNICVL